MPVTERMSLFFLILKWGLLCLVIWGILIPEKKFMQWLIFFIKDTTAKKEKIKKDQRDSAAAVFKGYFIYKEIYRQLYR